LQRIQAVKARILRVAPENSCPPKAPARHFFVFMRLGEDLG